MYSNGKPEVGSAETTDENRTMFINRLIKAKNSLDKTQFQTIFFSKNSTNNEIIVKIGHLN